MHRLRDKSHVETLQTTLIGCRSSWSLLERGTMWRPKEVGGLEGLGGLVKDAPFNRETSQEWGSWLHVRLPFPSFSELLSPSWLWRQCFFFVPGLICYTQPKIIMHFPLLPLWNILNAFNQLTFSTIIYLVFQNKHVILNNFALTFYFYIYTYQVPFFLCSKRMFVIRWFYYIPHERFLKLNVAVNWLKGPDILKWLLWEEGFTIRNIPINLLTVTKHFSVSRNAYSFVVKGNILNVLFD